MEDVLRRLLARIKRLESTTSKPRRGVVATLSPLTVTLGGSTTVVTATAAAGIPLVVNDQVVCETYGNGPPFIVGSIGAPSSWADYTPAWTSTGSQPTIGNGTLAGRWIKIGTHVTFRASLLAGSTTTFGTGIYTLSLPTAAAAGGRWICNADVLQTGVQHYVGTGIIASGATFEEILVMSNAIGPTNWSATSPFTFANTHRVSISGSYEAA
jgi:hypothetical protein